MLGLAANVITVDSVTVDISTSCGIFSRSDRNPTAASIVIKRSELAAALDLTVAKLMQKAGL